MALGFWGTMQGEGVIRVAEGPLFLLRLAQGLRD